MAPRPMCSTNRTSPRRRREGGSVQNDTENTQTLNRRPQKDYWGHKMKKKEAKMVRIAFVNVNGIGMYARDARSEDIRRFVNEKGVDVMGLAETNVHWGKVHAYHTLWDRTKRWAPDRRLGVAYNVHQRIPTTYQPGGTATIVVDDMAQRFHSAGQDTKELGRWSWVKVTGKQNCVTRFVTVYCPKITGKGMNTVYEQQLEFLKTDPTAKFWEDLAQSIVGWQNDGNQLVLMGDWNEAIVNGNLTEWMSTFGLSEAVTGIHGSNPPPTFHRGTDAIDGIFVSDSVKVKRAGYLAFGEIPGDHRGIWIDVPHKSILGYKMADIPKASSRRLKLDDPRIVQRYLDILDGYLAAHKVYSRLRRLISTHIEGSPLTTDQAKEYEELDNIRESGMIHAEKHCRKLRMGKVQWSPAMQQARDTITFWTLIRRRLKKCKVGARRIVRLKKKLGLKENTHLPLKEVEAKLVKARERYKICKQNDKVLRRDFLESLAEAKAAAGNVKVSTALQGIIHREEIRSTFQQIKRVTKTRQSGTIKIQVKRDGRVQEITKKTEMEKYIIKENEAKFHQTEGRCPLLHGKLYRDLGSMGDGPEVPNVLNGTYVPPPGTSPVTAQWLKSLQVDDPQQAKQEIASWQEFQTGWNKVKERTASGELHMGHFKAGARHRNVGWVHFHLSTLPMSSGYSPKRWQKGIDVMLLKSPEVYLLQKLRTIVLYEADFNHENKRLGRDSMKLALAKDQISDEQFSRPGRSAQDNALSKRLVFDYFRFKKRPFGMCACDLKSCYDRVVHTAASLALQRVGIPLSKIRCMFGTIQKLVHRIRTAFGLSKRTFGGLSSKYAKPPQGMGQGNGAGPSIWSILSSTVFDQLHAHGFSTPFCYSLSMGLYQLCGFSYVDDCDLIADGEDATEVHQKLCRMLDLWDELMEVNGAAIAPDKCWWYLVDFVWKGGEWKYHDAGTSLELQVRDKDNQINNLKYSKSSMAKEMVGVLLAPDGNEKEQLTTLKNKASEWAQKMRSSPLDARTIWTALRRTIIKGLEYPLAATTLSEAQLESVISPVLNSVLPRAGFARTFPRSVVYAPIAFQGLGVQNLWDFQFSRHIQDIVDQTWRDTPTGKLLRLNLEAAKLEAGVYGHLFDNSLNVTWFNTNSSWIIETYRYCRFREIVFEEPGEILRPRCTGDRAIMEVFVNAGYTTEQLRGLNRCRLYSRVVSVSEMSSGTGTMLPPCWFNRARYRADTTFDWPNQGKPTQQDWDMWDTALRTHVSQVLPLGLWSVPITHWIMKWEWFLSQGTLYRCREDLWTKYEYVQEGYRTQKYRISTSENCAPPNATTLEPTFTYPQGLFIIATGSRPSEMTRKNTHKTNSWEDILRAHPHSAWICQWISDTSMIDDCCKSLYNGDAIGVSDGSYDRDRDLCSAAWIVEFHPRLSIKGGGIVPGPAGTSNAYRGELGGILGQLLIVYTMEQYIPPTRPYDIRIACDGESALFRSLQATRDEFTSTNSSFDLISQIMVLREKIQGTLLPIHVRGHQDRESVQLTAMEALNVRMDTLAKEILQEAVDSGDDVPDALPVMSTGLPQVDYQDIPIGSSLASTIRSLISEDRAIAWWRYKGRFREGVQYKDVDWAVMADTTTESSFAMRRFISKWTCHHIGVGRMMNFRKSRVTNSCPRCGELDENTLHVLRCQSKPSRKTWKKGVRRLEQWMRQNRTRNDIRLSISAALRNFNRYEDFDTFVPPTFSAGVASCLEAQSKIGWIGFLEGFLSPQWSIEQEQYFRSIDQRRSGKRWAVGLSKQLWKLVFSMWEHRNEALFATTKIDDLSGIQMVKRAIIRERNIGLGTLDQSYKPYLSLPLSSFSKMKSIDLRRWLCLIRQAREESGVIYNDEITTDTALREWVGLNRRPRESQHREQGRRQQRKQRKKLRFIRTGYLD